MTPPMCIRCGAAPVERAFGMSNQSMRGPRFAFGVRWRWFCGTSCAAKDRNDGRTREAMQRVTRANVAACERRQLQRLIVACKDVIDVNGKVDPKDMVRVMMSELKKVYQRQYHQQRKTRTDVGAAA